MSGMHFYIRNYKNRFYDQSTSLGSDNIELLECEHILFIAIFSGKLL